MPLCEILPAACKCAYAAVRIPLLRATGTRTRQLLHGSARTNIITSCRLAIASKYSCILMLVATSPPIKLFLRVSLNHTSRSLAALLWLCMVNWRVTSDDHIYIPTAYNTFAGWSAGPLITLACRVPIDRIAGVGVVHARRGHTWFWSRTTYTRRSMDGIGTLHGVSAQYRR